MDSLEWQAILRYPSREQAPEFSAMWDKNQLKLTHVNADPTDEIALRDVVLKENNKLSPAEEEWAKKHGIK